ncbi:hypothetical protein HPB52_016925 [Rhipicephalus sanguineus]|uniref:Uncharacterized protein n=1 Tax=Rhipicephalus sanguineus TaxID=34632 RepID=A0A9D4PFW3_RHISA|nr:hypothetical protein HPB52_016925 [Rhipicephalus sanguineus]
MQYLRTANERVCAENLDAARKCVDAVIRRLRRHIFVQGVAKVDPQSLDDDCSAWEVHSGTIWGLERHSHDGRPWPLTALSDDGDVDDVGSPARFDVAVLMHDVPFGASHNCTSPTQTVSG